MKKITKAVVFPCGILGCILLTSAFVTANRGVAESGAQYEIYSSENFSKEYADNLTKAAEAYTAFFQYYYKRQSDSGVKVSGYTVNGVSNRFIPDFYGGAYVNKFGYLVIEVVDKYNTSDFYQSAVYKEILKATGAKSENIVIRFVNIAYGDLIDGMENVKKYVQSKDDIDSLGFGIDDYKNRIQIDISFAGDEKKGQIRKELDDILQGVPYEANYDEFEFKDEVGVYPGEDVLTSVGEFSLAFPVKIMVSGVYKVGFLTCAHAFGNIGSTNVYIEDDSCIGTYSSAYSNYGGNSDVAFVETNSNTEIYRTLYLGTTTIRAGYTNLPEGYPVYKNGASTRITSGTVKNSSYSMEVNNVAFTDFVKASYDSDSGDSGAIVYSEPDSFNCAYAVGIHKGSTSQLPWANAVYTKVSNALNDLGAVMY